LVTALHDPDAEAAGPLPVAAQLASALFAIILAESDRRDAAGREALDTDGRTQCHA
jgi:hypothetical protein